MLTKQPSLQSHEHVSFRWRNAGADNRAHVPDRSYSGHFATGTAAVQPAPSPFGEEQFGFIPFSFRRDVMVAALTGLGVAWSLNAISYLILPEAPSGFYSKNALQSVRPRSASELVVVCLVAVPAALLEEVLHGNSGWPVGSRLCGGGQPLVRVGGSLDDQRQPVRRGLPLALVFRACR